MSSAEDDIEGEEGEEPKKEAPKEPKPPSQIQLKLAEQAKYVAGKFELLFATTLKIEVGPSHSYSLCCTIPSLKQVDRQTDRSIHPA